ncbi:MAG TPA: SDR family oxidoreductase [Burkholderiales bacterium]
MAGLRGKVALVTGGSRGIGAAIVRRLAADGADVALTCVRARERAEAVAEAVRRGGCRALVLRADNAEPSALEAAVEETVARLGRLDVLVNNAGAFAVATLEEATLEQFDLMFAVNVRAVFAAARAASRRMSAGGRIITIGSNLAERVPSPGLALYAASKAALIGLTKGMARDLGPRAITVNLVQPGSTDTDMNPEDGPHADAQRAATAIGRFAEPSEIAALVAWLASEESGFVTGAVLTADGGANA